MTAMPGPRLIAMVAFAIDTYNFFAIPFLILFVTGYFWAGIATLWEEHQSKVRWQKAQDEARALARVG